MPESRLVLTGLDAANPLAFMAALGLLRVLTDQAGPGRMSPVRLGWRDNGRWVAELIGATDRPQLVAMLHFDAASWASEKALALAYGEDGALLAADAPRAVRDLKPHPSEFRRFCDQVAAEARPDGLRSARLAAAFGSEVVADNNGRLKPTALHFTAGQQKFLDMVSQLRVGLTQDDFHEALFGPWRNKSTLPSLSWNASAPRVYAYRATDPSGEKRGSVPAADWLAFCALGFFPVGVNGRALATTAVQGGWKDAVMTWPVWTVPISARVVGSLLGSFPRIPRSGWSSAGIACAYRSAILRSEQGGYGSFTPASVL
jgi:hypothetical protein